MYSCICLTNVVKCITFDTYSTETTQAVRFIVIPEYISCVMLTLIGVYSLYNKCRPSPKETAFHISLVLALIAMINNIISIYAIENSTRVSLLLSVCSNTVYYFSVAAMSTMVSVTAYFTMFDTRYHERRLRIATGVSMGCFALEAFLVLINLKTRWLFYFDGQKVYHSGPLNAIGLVFLLIAILNIVFFYALERKCVKKSVKLIIYTLPAIVVILGIVQYVLKNTILTGTIIGFSLLTLFISGQQQREHIDAMTELLNREAFFSELTRLSLRHRCYRVVLIRLKNFKSVNTQYGQRDGDRILGEIAKFISQLDVRVLTYRIQGVEFAIVVPNMKDEEYERFFQTLTERFADTWQTEHGAIRLRALFADILYPEQASNVDELVGSLEYAMRAAKGDPSGKPVRFDSDMRAQYKRRSYIIKRMEEALRNDHFFLNFQPVYNTKYQQFSGGEVLLRLNEENGKPILPSEFIPIAIENGIATELGFMVMEKTCRFLHEHRNTDLGWLSINISSQQDEFDDTVRHLGMLLEKYQIDPCRIKLEITELVLLEDLERTQKTIDMLNQRGVGVFLDDFGTGYSNLVNVMTLPFQCVKIDKGFIRDLTIESKGYAMLKTIVGGLQAMKVSVLAEGVETLEQDNIVRLLGIEQIQGFFYAKPMLGDEFVWLLNQHKPLDVKIDCPTEHL